METLGNAIESNRKVLFADKGGRYALKFAHPEHYLRLGLEHYAGKDYQWIPAYDQIVEWMQNTEFKGLLLMGDNGLGKTLIARFILPKLIEINFELVCNCFDATELAKDPDHVMMHKIIMVDDIGMEGETVHYGERRVAFAELCDKAEKEGKLLILTTNLNPGEIEAKYGRRVLDRLHTLTRRVVLTGQSMRH